MTHKNINQQSTEPTALQFIEQQCEGLAPSCDRLITTLFLVALLHVILITGITFIEPISAFKDVTPTLKVLLLNDASLNNKNPKGTYLSQQNQTGNATGANEQLSGSPNNDLLMMDNEGTEDGNTLQSSPSTSRTLSVRIISARNSKLKTLNGDENNTNAIYNQSPLALIRSLPSPINTELNDRVLNLDGPRSREVIIMPNTRESPFVTYTERWKSKVERLGTLNYPRSVQHAKQKNNPVLEVVINADGKLKSAVVTRSSGDPEVDQAALNILKLATPFEAFSNNFKKDYNQLRFSYEWQFLDQ